MNWIQETFLQPTMIQTVAVICIVCAIGVYLGKLKYKGVSLGITFVFFTGILVSHFGVVVNSDMLTFAQNFGLIVFVYTLLHYLTGISVSDMMGLLCGAANNTPSLGAAQEAMLQINSTDEKSITDMALACAVAYPMGVIGVILAIIVLKALFQNKKKENNAEMGQTQTFVAEFQVCNPAIYHMSIKDIMTLTEKHFVISRVWRNGKVSIPTSDTTLEEGDHLLIISVKADVDNIKVLFGEQENVDWNKPDIDWNAIDSQLISRRIVVTRNRINGVRLGSLRLRNLYGINITRVNRAGIDLLASPDLHLQIGDRLTIVGEANAVNNVSKILGDQLKRLREPNLLAIFVGLTLGVIIGSIPLAVPGMNTPIKLGVAGGPIIVGILMGAFGPRIHLTTYTTQSANLMMRQFGITIYLAGLGISSGQHFFETVFRTEGLLWLGLGFALAIIPVLLVGLVMARFFQVDYAKNVGMLCGCMTNPIALDYANTTVEGDEPSVAYATVYPMATFMRIITAQLVIMLFQ